MTSIDALLWSETGCTCATPWNFSRYFRTIRSETATAKLRKENQQLREEIADLQENLKQITANISKKNESLIDQDGSHASQSTKATDKDKSLELISAQNDDLILFKNNTMKELKHINQQVNIISNKFEVIANAIEQIEDYSYQYNIKITGVQTCFIVISNFVQNSAFNVYTIQFRCKERV